MTQKELNTIIENHQHWLKKDCEGWKDMRAILAKADLSGVNLSGVNLTGVNLSGANLSRANLSGVNLSGARLSRANLSGADLSGARLSRASLDDFEKYRFGQVLKEPITGYKKTAEGVVITAEIPAGAIVFCINGWKCRTNKAKITDMDGKKLLHSRYDNSFEYTLGKEVVIDDFNLMYNVECASGFHFFRTRDEAENY